MSVNRKKIYILMVACILLIQICLVIYKAHYTGITYDESYTAQHFTKNIHQALNSYENQSNNHVLNSVFIAITDKFFKSYEHFIRIHSVVFAILFSASIAYIIHKTILSRILKVALLALVILNWFVFDLSFLARGYSIALGAVYAATAAIVALLNHKIKYKYRWLPITILVTMNFLALGSMLTGIFILLSINGIFILLYSYAVFRDAPNKLRPLLLNLIFVALVTFVCSFLLYKNIYKDVLNARSYFGGAPFVPYIKQLLVDNLTGHNTDFGRIVFIAFVILTTLGAVLAIRKTYLIIKNNTLQKWISTDNSGRFIIFITIGTILAMFFCRTIIKSSLGYARNGVFLLPLALISSGILIETLWVSLKNTGFLNLTVRAFTVISIILLIFQNRPSAYAVEVHNWKQQSISGPLLRRLKKINPDKKWRIGLTSETKNIKLPLSYYYSQEFYKQAASYTKKDLDIAILDKTEKPADAPTLDEKLFNKFDCSVIIYPKNFYDFSR